MIGRAAAPQPAGPAAMPATGRRVVLFPGAFRPPHVNHFVTVAHFAEADDIDEVVVIISNRTRPVPGTDKVLTVDAAHDVWEIFIGGHPKTAVVVAETSAVRHAIDLVEKGADGDEYLLVVGEKDTAQGRRRFGKLRDLTDRGATATVVEALPNVMKADASDLRRFMSDGEGSYPFFSAAMPLHLGPEERRRVWDICLTAMSDRVEVDSRRIVKVLAERGVGATVSVVPVDAADPDTSYEVVLTDGRDVVVKYANDAVSADGIDSGSRGSRRRLKAERECLKWLKRQEFGVALPEVLCFDSETRTLVLSPVLPAGRPLSDDLSDGHFDHHVAELLGRFLASAHWCLDPPDPMWGSTERDQRHWHSILDVRTRASLQQSAEAHAAVSNLREASEAACSFGFRHLGLAPSNIRVEEGVVGIADFEMSSSVGDPAFDIGTLLAAYLGAGIAAGFPSSCGRAIASFERGYRQVADAKWDVMASRSSAFAGTALIDVERHDRTILTYANALLSIGFRSRHGSVAQLLADFGVVS